MHNDGTPRNELEKPQLNSISPVPFDPDKYRHFIDDYDLTYEQKNELLRIIAEIMRQFIDLGFNIHPIQCAQGTNKNTVDVVELLQLLWEVDDQSERGDT